MSGMKPRKLGKPPSDNVVSLPKSEQALLDEAHELLNRLVVTLNAAKAQHGVVISFQIGPRDPNPANAAKAPLALVSFKTEKSLI